MFVQQESAAAQNEIELREMIQETNKQIIINNSKVSCKDDEASSVDSYAVETIKVATEEKKEKEIQARVRELRKIKLLYSKHQLIVQLYKIYEFVNLITGRNPVIFLNLNLII